MGRSLGMLKLTQFGLQDSFYAFKPLVNLFFAIPEEVWNDKLCDNGHTDEGKCKIVTKHGSEIL